MLVYGIGLKDKNNKLLSYEEHPAECFIVNGLRLLECYMGDKLVTMTDTSGSVYTDVFPDAIVGIVGAGSGDQSFGIQIGTDATAVDINDTKLGSQVAHGTGAGQVQYSGTTFAQPSCDTTHCEFGFTRDFSNDSGADIVIYEIGFAYQAKCKSDYSSYTYNFLGARDVISGGITIPNGNILTITYKIEANL